MVARDPQPDPRSTSQRAERVPSCPQLPPAAASAPQVKLTVLPVEIPLVTEELEDIDRRLSTAEQTLFWHHEGKSPPGQDPACASGGPCRREPCAPGDSTVLPRTRSQQGLSPPLHLKCRFPTPGQGQVWGRQRVPAVVKCPQRLTDQAVPASSPHRQLCFPPRCHGIHSGDERYLVCLKQPSPENKVKRGKCQAADGGSRILLVALQTPFLVSI